VLAAAVGTEAGAVGPVAEGLDEDGPEAEEAPDLGLHGQLVWGSTLLQAETINVNIMRLFELFILLYYNLYTNKETSYTQPSVIIPKLGDT
jgi:hypothetical protein